MVKVKINVVTMILQTTHILNQREYLSVQIIGLNSTTEQKKCRTKYMKKMIVLNSKLVSEFKANQVSKYIPCHG